MKAILYDQFGPSSVVAWRNTARPTPGPGQVLLKVQAAALNPKDVLVRKGRMKLLSGSRFPRTPGHDVAGVVVEKHPSVTDFDLGDALYGMISPWTAGSCAQFVAVDTTDLAPQPPEFDPAHAAAIPLVSLTALQALRDQLQVGPNTHVCLNGASGGVGTVAVQIARALGARVTAVCSGRNAEHVTQLGAHQVIDYTQTDLRATTERFDAFFDIYGNHPYPKVKHLLKPKGRFATAIPRLSSVRRELMARAGLGRAHLVIVRSHRPDLDQISGWLLQGALRPIIDRQMPMDACAQAMTYLETRRARGKIILLPPEGAP